MDYKIILGIIAASIAALFAMTTHSIITVLNPLVLIVANCSFSFFLVWRRRLLFK